MVLCTSRTQHCPKLFPPQGFNIEIWFWNHFSLSSKGGKPIYYNITDGRGPYVRVSKVSYNKRVMMILHEGWWFRKLCEKMKRRIPCSISEAPNKTNSPPPRLVANKSFSPVSARAQFPKISNTNQIYFDYWESTWSLLFWKIQFSLEKYLSKGSIEPVAAGFIGFWPHYKIFPTIVTAK